MSTDNEELKLPIKPNEPEQKMPRLVIELNEVGNVIVTGPLYDKILCYGMIETAKNIIHAHHVKQTPKIKPPHRIMDFLRNGKKD